MGNDASKQQALIIGIKLCEAAMKSTNTPVPAENNYTRPAPTVSGDGQVRMLMCALDYKRTKNPLTCTMDAENMKKLCTACNIEDLTVMYDEECTSEKVSAAIEEVAGRCDENDYFVFYYSGHGTSKPDQDGDEEDGMDECFCFVDDNGQISLETCMDDDTFAECVTSACPAGCRILILTDCCHSGTIADLENPAWKDFEALSIAGCLDSQTSGDVGKGGIFTHSMLLAIDKLQSEDEYSTGMLYNATLKYDDSVFHSAQDITIQTNSRCKPDTFAWPLIPQVPYMSPMSKAKGSTRGIDLGGSGGGDGLNPAMMQQFGIKPELAALASTAGAGDLDPEELLAAGAKPGCVMQ